MSTSSNFRWCACLRACAKSRDVFSSSTETRRPRSEIKSMVSASFASSSGKTLPHAEFERAEIGGLQEAAGRDHDVGGGDRTFRNRCEVFAGLPARRIATAGGRDQPLQRVGGKKVEPAGGDAALNRLGKTSRLGRSAIIRLGGWLRRRLGGPAAACAVRRAAHCAPGYTLRRGHNRRLPCGRSRTFSVLAGGRSRIRRF